MLKSSVESIIENFIFTYPNCTSRMNFKIKKGHIFYISNIIQLEIHARFFPFHEKCKYYLKSRLKKGTKLGLITTKTLHLKGQVKPYYRFKFSEVSH